MHLDSILVHEKQGICRHTLGVHLAFFKLKSLTQLLMAS